ncbi:MAG: YfhO family protein [Spirochaetia bacterium]|nr:YfhO family protein [Spirochaetia bacterium]
MFDFARRAATSHRTPLLLLALFIALFLLTRSNLNKLDDAYNFADNLSYDLPMQQYFNERLLKGELPLWNAYQSAGNPMIGTLEARLIYPPRLFLTVVFGLDRGQFLEVIFHFCLTVLGSYAMLRSFRMRRMASMLGATTVMLSTEFLSAFAAFNVIATFAWVPVCIWSIRRFLYQPDMLRSAILGFCFSMLIYGGYPQYAYYAAHAAGIVFVFGAYHFRRKIFTKPRLYGTYLMVAMTLFALISAAQLLSASELFSRGLRSEVGVTIQQFNPFGSRSIFSLLPQLYEGGKIPPPQPGQAPEVRYPIQAYAFALIVCAAVFVGYLRLRWFRERIVTMLAVFIPFALLATGSLFANFIFNYYPLGSAFRLPQRALFLLLFPSAFFIALAFTVLRQSIQNKTLRIAIQAAFVLGMGSLLLPGKQFKTQAFINVSKHINHYAENIQKAIPESSDHHYDTICWFGLEPCQKAGMIARRRSLSDYEPANTYRSYLFSRLVSSELRNLPAGYLWLGETNINIKTFADPSALRLLQISSVKWIMGSSELWRKTDTDTLANIRHVGLVSAVNTIPDDTTRAILLEQIGEARLKLLTQLLPGDTSLYTIFKLEGAVSRAYLTNQVVVSKSARESAQILEPPFDPKKQTVLEIPSDLLPVPSNIKPQDHLKRAEFIVDEPERIVIHAESAGDSFLVLNDKFFPGWECKVDGQDSEIFPANVMFRAVKLSPGTHQIEFLYRPRSLYVTFLISLVGYAIVIALVILGLKRTRQKRAIT